MSYTVQAETHEIPELLRSIYQADAELLTRVPVDAMYLDTFPSALPEPDASDYWARLKVQEMIIPGGSFAPVDGMARPKILVVAEIAHVENAAFRPAPLLAGIIRRVQQLTLGVSPAVTRCRVIDPLCVVRRPNSTPVREEDPDRWWSSVRFALTVKPL